MAVPLMKMVLGGFVIMILIQLCAALRCLHLIVQQGVHRDIHAFMREYWQWSHVRENSLVLSLWVSSLVAYLSLWLITASLADISMGISLSKAPLESLYVIVMLVLLLAYTFYRSRSQIQSTRKTIKDLKRMRLYKSFRRVLQSVQSAPVSATHWGMWMATLASGAEWVSEQMVRRRVDTQMKAALVEFSVIATMEYLVRMSVVAVGVWIVYL